MNDIDIIFIKLIKLNLAIVNIIGENFQLLNPFLLSFPSHNSFRNKKSSFNSFLFFVDVNKVDFLITSFFS